MAKRHANPYKKPAYISPLKIIQAALNQASGNGIEAARWGKTTTPILPLDLRPRLALDSARSHWQVETIAQCKLRQYHEAVGMVQTPEDILTAANREWMQCLVRWLLRIAKTMVIEANKTPCHLIDEGESAAPNWTVRRTVIDARYGNPKDGYVTLLIEPLPLKAFLRLFRVEASKRESYIQEHHSGIYARAQFALDWTQDTHASLIFVCQDDCDMGEVAIKRSRAYAKRLRERAEEIVERIEAGDEPMPEHTPGEHPDCASCSIYDECVSLKDNPLFCVSEQVALV